MQHKDFLRQLDQDAIVRAIAHAEAASTGQIRVFVSRRAADDPLQAAAARFSKLEMEKTASRNAVLIYLAPRARKFAIVGDTGIHQRCGGDEFWTALAGGTMQPLLRAGKFTQAIIGAVRTVGEELAKHFPRGADEPAGANELPDSVETD